MNKHENTEAGWSSSMLPTSCLAAPAELMVCLCHRCCVVDVTHGGRYVVILRLSRNIVCNVGVSVSFSDLLVD
jgi:hypothetical protein